jgi:hypothetical protein
MDDDAPYPGLPEVYNAIQALLRAGCTEAAHAALARGVLPGMGQESDGKHSSRGLTWQREQGEGRICLMSTSQRNVGDG